MFKYLGKLLSWKSQGPKDLLIRISLITAISSALFTNDTSCIALTKFVLEISRQHNLAPHPFLLAVASSANIGSAATPIGNPQNLVIAIESGISFMDFLLGILPATIMGILINTLLLLGMYWKLLDGTKRDDDEETIMSSSTITPEEAQEILNLHSFLTVYMSHVPPLVTLSPRILIKKIQSSPYLRGLVGGTFERPRNNRFIFSKNDVLKIFERNPNFISKLEAVNESTSMSLAAPLLDQNGEENVREEASNALVQVEAQGVDWKGLAWKCLLYYTWNVGWLVN